MVAVTFQPRERVLAHKMTKFEQVHCHLPSFVHVTVILACTIGGLVIREYVLQFQANGITGSGVMADFLSCVLLRAASIKK